MKVPEVRALVNSYFAAREQVDQGVLPPTAMDHLCNYTVWVEQECARIANGSPPTRWACSIVGPVLAAAMGATTHMPTFQSQNSVLRVFGLIGDHPLPAQRAWSLVMPYAHEPVIPAAALDHIARSTGMQLTLPADPSPLDVLIELTRLRSSPFAVQVAYWLCELFRSPAMHDNPYADPYQTALGPLLESNRIGGLANLAGSRAVKGNPTPEEWESLLRGRLPQSRIEARAGYVAVRKFILDYWAEWKPKPLAAAAR